ncbi:dTDP-glucose 4,6-dehydratase [Evansella sp. AB-rgal1]|uniref:dTDP-glucose 4,6-dehydratase n=1 Tax=Evansella sp. AB-rgal1 TaxID=3242696 RepID=UPI00359DB9D0
MRVLLIGGAGFIGTNFTQYIFEQNPNDVVINFSTTTSHSSRKNVALFANNPNYHHIEGRIEDAEALRNSFHNLVDVVVNFAAKTNVDQSNDHPTSVISNNILGTQRVLEMAYECKVPRFVQISSVEVYGAIEMNQHVYENSTLTPINPYAVSKASSDLLAMSYVKRFGMDVIIARSTNNYGPYQATDKLIPRVITKALFEEKIPLFGDGTHMRDWMHVKDHCSALYKIMCHGTSNSIYNISSNCIASTREIIERILQLTNRPFSLMETVPGRVGDHNRYAPRTDKLRMELLWKPKYDLDNGLSETVEWYRNNASIMVGR